jgi:hypothetical protein
MDMLTWDSRAAKFLYVILICVIPCIFSYDCNHSTNKCTIIRFSLVFLKWLKVFACWAFTILICIIPCIFSYDCNNSTNKCTIIRDDQIRSKHVGKVYIYNKE